LGSYLDLDEIFNTLNIDLDKRLFQLRQKELVNILNEMTKKKNKKFLSKLISDSDYFDSTDLVKSFEKTNKPLLFKILNEPEEEQDLRIPIANWLKGLEYQIDYEYKLPNQRREIDVIGCKFSRLVGFIGEDSIVAVEIKSRPSRSAIDSAFSQAKDYVVCSDYSYVAVSPYLFLKYSDVLLDKVEKFDNEIGLIVADKSKVQVVRKADETDYNNSKYKMIINDFKER
jgi:hypothetical protein